VPVTYWIDHEAKIIFTKIEGVVTDEDIITHQKQTRDNPELDPSYGQLIDLSNIQKLEITTQAVHEFTSLKFSTVWSRRAFVAPDDLSYGFARMFQMMRDSIDERTEVFRDMEEARHWLDLSEK
jgi:hypothetical protein